MQAHVFLHALRAHIHGSSLISPPHSRTPFPHCCDSVTPVDHGAVHAEVPVCQPLVTTTHYVPHSLITHIVTVMSQRHRENTHLHTHAHTDTQHLPACLQFDRANLCGPWHRARRDPSANERDCRHLHHLAHDLTLRPADEGVMCACDCVCDCVCMCVGL